MTILLKMLVKVLSFFKGVGLLQDVIAPYLFRGGFMRELIERIIKERLIERVLVYVAKTIREWLC